MLSNNFKKIFLFSLLLLLSLNIQAQYQKIEGILTIYYETGDSLAVKIESISMYASFIEYYPEATPKKREKAKVKDMKGFTINSPSLSNTIAYTKIGIRMGKLIAYNDQYLLVSYIDYEHIHNLVDRKTHKQIANFYANNSLEASPLKRYLAFIEKHFGPEAEKKMNITLEGKHSVTTYTNVNLGVKPYVIKEGI